MQPSQKPQKRQLRIEMPNTLDSTYANTVMISHTGAEFVLDFIHVIPNMPRASVQKRVVMTPVHAKMFLRALEENIGRYEAKNGEINTPPKPESLADQLFRSVRPEDENEEDDDE